MLEEVRVFISGNGVVWLPFWYANFRDIVAWHTHSLDTGRFLESHTASSLAHLGAPIRFHRLHLHGAACVHVEGLVKVIR